MWKGSNIVQNAPNIQALYGKGTRGVTFSNNSESGIKT